MTTPLLRKIYVVFAAVVAVYLSILLFEYSAWNKERLYRQLVTGNTLERASAGFDLAYLQGEKQLLRALQSRSPAVRSVAMNSLFDLWARAGGHRAFRRMQAADRAIGRQAYADALEILTRLTREYPRFPEAWNRRATLYWQMGRLEESIADAERVVELNPNHFGAWQGLGLCHAHRGDLEQACQCMRMALRITPQDVFLRKLVGRWEEVLHLRSPRTRVEYHLI